MKVPGMAGSFHQRTIKNPKTGKIKGKYWYHYTYDPISKQMKSERRDPPSGDLSPEVSNVDNDLSIHQVDTILEGAKLLLALFETVSSASIPEFDMQLSVWVEEEPKRLEMILQLEEALQ